MYRYGGRQQCPHHHYFHTLLPYTLLTASCTDGEVRLVVGQDNEFFLQETDYDSHYYDDVELRIGRVEVCLGGRYGTICDDFWGHNEASVVCKQLEMSPYGTYVVSKITRSHCMSSQPNLCRCSWPVQSIILL